MRIKIKEIEYQLTAYPTKMWLILEKKYLWYKYLEVVCHRENSGEIQVTINFWDKGSKYCPIMMETIIKNQTYKDLAYKLEEYFDFKEGLLDNWKKKKRTLKIN